MLDSLPRLLTTVQEYASGWISDIANRPVAATATSTELRKILGGKVPLASTPPARIVEDLIKGAGIGTVASIGPRYFGFVVGGNLPAALASDWLVSTWDQNGAIYALSPFASIIEEITGSWLRQIFGLPSTMTCGFATGCTMANFTGLAAARHHVLQEAGWDVESEGLFGAPTIDVIVSEESHYSISIALRLLGLGSDRVHRIPTDDQGRLCSKDLETSLRNCSCRCIICAQAGNVNTGAIDPLDEISSIAKEHGAWLHVDGAFGLWAAISPQHTHSMQGIANADSIACDAHKWLNVPYDCSFVFCSNELAHRSAMSLAADYITETGNERDSHEYVPEESRRARAIPVYAALRALGSQGLSEMIERHCRYAQMFANALRSAGYKILNDVTLNQVLVSFGTKEVTRKTIQNINRDGTCWCGGTIWKGQYAMRISVCNWSTTDADIMKSIRVILKAAEDARHN